MWARTSSSEKGTAVTTRFIRTTWATGGVLPSYSARILRASSSHSSLRNGYDGIAALLVVHRSRSVCRNSIAPPRRHVAAEPLPSPPVGCRSVIPGAEPYSATGDARGALVLH